MGDVLEAGQTTNLFQFCVGGLLCKLVLYYKNWWIAMETGIMT